MRIVQMQYIAFGALLLLTSTVIFGQSPRTAKPQAQRTEADRVQDLRLGWLEDRVEASFANLDCNTRGFDSLTMTSPKLVMFALCKNIEPYLEGHKVTISIGNPHTFSFGTISGQVGYGKEFANQTVDLNYAGSLQPGKWTDIVVTINPSKPEELRKLTISLGAKTAVNGW